MQEVERDGWSRFRSVGSLAGSCPRKPRWSRGTRGCRAPLPERTPKRRMLRHRQPVRDDRLGPAAATSSSTRSSRATRSRRSTPRSASTQPRSPRGAREGYDVVVAFGGDGTVNEAANGLVGSETPLTALPGGSTNVWARTLGIPNDVVDATEHLLTMADEFRPFRVDLGRATARYFVFAAGVGLDASVVERVDPPPAAQGALRRLVLRLRGGRHLHAPLPGPPAARAGPRRRPRARGRDRDRPELRPVHVLPQAADPGRRGRRADSGSLGAAVLKSATPLELPTLVPRLLSGRAKTVLRHRQVESLGRAGHPARGGDRGASVPRPGGRRLHRRIRGDRVQRGPGRAAGQSPQTVGVTGKRRRPTRCCAGA